MKDENIVLKFESI